MTRLLLSAMLCSWGWMTSPLAADDPRPDKPIVVSYPAPSQTEQRIHAALKVRSDAAFSDVPLTEVVKFLEDYQGIQIILDTAALQYIGVDPSSPINLQLTGVAFRSELNLILRPLQLTYLVEDEVLKITTLEKANEALTTRVYPVRDLADDAEELDSMIEAIQAGCDQTGWSSSSNKSITAVKKSRSLVIRQTQKVHEEIEALLRDLRAANVVETDRRVN